MIRAALLLIPVIAIAILVRDPAPSRGPVGATSERSTLGSGVRSAPSVTSKATGASVRWPRSTWRVRSTGNPLRLASVDRTASIALTAAPGPGDADSVLAFAVKELDDLYKDASVSPAGHPHLAGLPAASARVSAQNKRGARVNILVTAARSHGRGYVLEVFAAEGAPAKRLTEAQAIVNSLRLAAPPRARDGNS